MGLQKDDRSVERISGVFYILVAVILSIIFIAAWHLREHATPFYLHNADPEYCYFFNALNILQGKSPGHVDHPGTPLQMLGALVIRLASILTNDGHSSDSLVSNALDFPEFQLLAMNIALNALFF